MPPFRYAYFAYLMMALSLVAIQAHAETVTFGLLLGPAIRSVDGTAMGFEVKGGYRFLQNVSTNLYYWRVSSGSDLSGSNATISASDSLSSFGAEALYAFPGTNWSAGAKLGLVKNSTDGNATSNGTTVALSENQSSFAVAPTLLYEIPVSFLLVGGEAAYFYTLSSSVPKALSLMAEARVRF